MEQVWLIPIKESINFVVWWGNEVPRIILRFTRDLLFSFESNLQFRANLKLWLTIEPMFGDYTWSGRTIGFLIRGIRVIVTIFVYLIILISGGLATLIWLLLPFLLVFKALF